jgi:hypothetical protein
VTGETANITTLDGEPTLVAIPQFDYKQNDETSATQTREPLSLMPGEVGGEV